MFGISATDLVLILVLAMVMFGPEKLPEYSRKAARLFVYFRDIANSAKTTLRTELGPEYADLELKDLHPKTFIAKQLREEVALIEDAKRELLDASNTLKDSAAEVKNATDLSALKAAAAGDSALAEPPSDAMALVAPVTSPFDPEAT
ncbi:sec-independent translocase [Tessaracoccus massiliensis]|uniref:sec-independent translocase n=1 Tax=Tessaracoccus massiliensis TaxID=1522311 RepID=UPI00058DE17B|nr:sec-independent translocase [Tessaracoccus massiliensis]